MKLKITSLTHDELVSIFSTATYGSEWLSITTKEEYGAIIPSNMDAIKEKFVNKHRTYCREDKWADILLNGGTIVAIDYFDEDENGEEGKCYPIKLQDMLNGLSKAAKECPKAYSRVITFDGSEDYYDAMNVMQCVMFGEVVYG